MNPTRIAFATGALFAASVVLSFIHPWGNLRSGVKADAPLLEGSAVPDEVRHVLETKCADCHSRQIPIGPYTAGWRQVPG